MKVHKLSLLVFCLIFSFEQNSISAQNDSGNSLHYTLLHEVVITEFDFLQKESLDKSVVIFPNVVFQIIEKLEIGGQPYSVIKPIKRIEEKKKRADSIDAVPQFEKAKLLNYYLVKSNSLEDNLEIYTPKTWKMRVGIANIPVKFYLPNNDSSFDFSGSSISLGATLGIAQQISERKSDLWLNYLISMNFTMVTPRSDDFDSDDFDGNPLSALSPAIGIALSFDEAEVGLFAGKDFLPGSAADAWKFNGKTWFSVSIGTTFGVGE